MNEQQLLKIALSIKEHAKQWYLKKMAAAKMIETIGAYKESLKS